VGDGDAYQHTEQREDGHYADRSLDTARLYIPRELDRTLTDALLACSVAQEARITLPDASLRPGHCERKPLHFEGKRTVTSASLTTGGASKAWFSLRTA